MKKNGFITSALLYGMLALFLVLMLGSLAILSNRKLSMDKLKEASIADTKAGDEVVETESALAYDYINNRLDFNNGDGHIYRGNTPNNYINFNGSTWRIVSIEPDHTLKIISVTEENQAYNTNEPNEGEDFDPIEWGARNSLNLYLNGDYLNSLTSKALISQHNFDVGTVSGDEDNLEDIKALTQDVTWNGSVGLISISDYFNSNSEEKCRNFDSDSAECASSTYINGTMTVTTNGEEVYIISDSGYNLQSVTEPSDVKPVVYLKSGTRISSGDGSKSTPFEVETS